MATSPRITALLGFLLSASIAAAAEPLPFPNPGFEDGLQNWVVDQNDQTLGLSQVKPEAAHTGKAGLRVTQKDDGPGSWLQSARIPVDAGQTYRLGFWNRIVATSGIGVWVQFYDQDRHPIKSPGGDPTLQLLPAPTGWTQQQLTVTAPADAAFFSLAIHAYSKHAVLADFDDFSLTPVDATAAATATTETIITAAAPMAKPVPNALTPSPARVQEIASDLPAKAHGLGPTLSDRAAWAALVASDKDMSEKTIAHATRFLDQPIPVITPAIYNAAVQSGNRTTADNLISQRRFRLVNFVIAEGIENKGRFLPAIEKEVAAICAEPSWTLPAHVQFSGGRNDLGTAMTGWNLAAVDTMLGDKLSPGLRATIRQRVRERLIAPYLAEIRGETKPEWWATNPNNWNAVVHAGIVGSALALDDSVEERAEIIAAAEIGTQYYIKGFPTDGYSTEGMGYWKYGFGHYVLLAETVFDATGGKVDFYKRNNIRLVAQFPRRFEMSPGIYPAYGDAQFLEVPCGWLFHIIDHRYGLGDNTPINMFPDPTFCAFLYTYGAVMGFDSNAPPIVTTGTLIAHGHRLRDWFDESQIYVGRPPEGAGAAALSFSFKGNNNGTSHGHNDIGTFVVATGGQPVLVDPGVPVYNAVTMGPNAYQFQIKSSYGHSVPLVAGQLQKRGSQYAATVKAKSFSATLDSITLDLAPAYDLPSVRELTRRYDYSRAGTGSVTITDHVVFASPQAFGTALVTYGVAREEKPGVWTVTYQGQSVRVEITTAGAAPFTVTDEMLRDESRFGKVRRLGINLDAPVTEATITIKVTAP